MKQQRIEREMQTDRKDKRTKKAEKYIARKGGEGKKLSLIKNVTNVQTYGTTDGWTQGISEIALRSQI